MTGGEGGGVNDYLSRTQQGFLSFFTFAFSTSALLHHRFILILTCLSPIFLPSVLWVVRGHSSIYLQLIKIWVGVGGRGKEWGTGVGIIGWGKW